jgi:hypothetical protein
MNMFEAELNGGCRSEGHVAQRLGAGTRVILHDTSCPTLNPPYCFLWLVAEDNARSRALLIATPSVGSAALLAGGQRLLPALGPPAAASAPQPAAPSGARDVQTLRGLLRDKPYAMSVPAGLAEQPGGRSDLTLSDPQQEIEVTLDIRSATPSLSADFDFRAFGDGEDFLRMLRRSVPGAGLIGNGVLRLPGGSAHVVHWSAPGYRYIDASLYEDGRQYRLSFAVREGAFARRQAMVGFILANFSMTSTPRPCCAAPIILP